jgi:hypothetical protein
MKKMNKKAQIGDTLTWFMAFIIIFFIIILFITASIIISGQKEMPILGIGGNSISVSQNSLEDLELDRNLIKILNTPVEFKGEKIKISELIIKWDNSEGVERKNIEETLKKGINQILPRYYFTIHRNSPGTFLAFENNPEKVSRTSEYKFSLIYLASDKGVLKISLSLNKYEMPI